eukprot:scaffold3870_cov246-Pinguiococcus_pyrenoidosus.AAC.13
MRQLTRSSLSVFSSRCPASRKPASKYYLLHRCRRLRSGWVKSDHHHAGVGVRATSHSHPPQRHAEKARA